LPLSMVPSCHGKSTPEAGIVVFHWPIALFTQKG
jgi:hypothetical protein